MRGHYPCTYLKACHVLHAKFELGWSQTKIAIELELNGGTVSKIVNGLRFPTATPIPF